MRKYPDNAEWLEADGLGGFASGTVGGERTRRYHAVLLAAANPPTERFVLVNGLDAAVETAGGRYEISTQRYLSDVVHPNGTQRLESFSPDPWPTWVFRLEDGTRVQQEILVTRGAPRTVIRWRLLTPINGARLHVRPFFSGRDYHALQSANPAFRFEPQRDANTCIWRPYDGVPAVIVRSNAEYRHEPQWYYQFLYTQERERGLNDLEDLASPGVFTWDLTQDDAVWVLEADTPGSNSPATKDADRNIVDEVGQLAASEEARRKKVGGSIKTDSERGTVPFFSQGTEKMGQSPSVLMQPLGSRLDRSADTYLVRRGDSAQTIVAGYPWFTDWGRDTFIAIRGLCLATGRLDVAREILAAWAGVVSQGMLPNRFPDHGETPEFNSVDASLWFIVAMHELFEEHRAAGTELDSGLRRRLIGAVEEILTGYVRGTRHQIRLDDDALLSAGEPGVQLTWMDVKLGDWVVTPRIGKPVEVQALWLNALWAATRFAPEWKRLLQRGREAFNTRFWNPATGSLYDVVDVDHRPGVVDDTFRPNQILAVGGLPLQLIDGERAKRIVNSVEERLLTPLGLRTLAPDSPGYTAHYEGGVWQRDSAYHQGTVWPWLMGPFVEAWVRVRGGTQSAKTEARARFVEPLLDHLDEYGLGHLPEIADAEPPHTPRGCPFQAWSLGELLRLDRRVLIERRADAPVRKPRQPAIR